MIYEFGLFYFLNNELHIIYTNNKTYVLAGVWEQGTIQFDV